MREGLVSTTIQVGRTAVHAWTADVLLSHNFSHERHHMYPSAATALQGLAVTYFVREKLALGN